jgi:glycosyltransferase involved in cell wall biosynthesis
MHVLNLTTDFGKGGAEKVFSQLGDLLGRRYEVTDCVFNRAGVRAYPSSNRTIDLDVPAAGGLVLKILYFFIRIIRLRRIKRSLNIDVAISHLEGADYINILARTSGKVVLCIHGSKVHDKEISGLTGWIRKNVLIPFLYRRADVIVAVSTAIKSELEEYFGIDPRRIKIIHNFFETGRIVKMSGEDITPDYRKLMEKYEVLITSGRLAPQKNHALLIPVLKKMLINRPGIKLIILGDGELYSHLLSEAVSSGILVQHPSDPFCEDNQLFLPGYVTNPFSYISRAQIFLLPSLWEGFPLALCEAMICGVPVIAHDCETGPREILAPAERVSDTVSGIYYGSNGILLEVLSGTEQLIKNWTDSITYLLGHPVQRAAMVASARRRSMDFDVSAIEKQWFDLIGTL